MCDAFLSPSTDLRLSKQSCSPIMRSNSSAHARTQFALVALKFVPQRSSPFALAYTLALSGRRRFVATASLDAAAAAAATLYTCARDSLAPAH